MSSKPFKLGDKCRAGHTLTEENTYVEGTRLRCSDCLRARKPLKGRALKTHCVNGHEYTEENTYWYNGYRACKECRKSRVYETRSVGVGRGGVNKAKTHCPQGHEYTTENTIWSKDGKRRSCKECYNYRQREMNITRHGISVAGKQRMLEAQDNKCLICKIEFTCEMSKCVDHDHECCDDLYSCGKCIRGILCVDCNRLLGDARDSIDVLQSAINYLQNYNNGQEIRGTIL